MPARFEELDWRETPMGAISLRRRREPSLGVDVFEAKLDDDFLMSSLFVVAEEELARLGLAAAGGDGLDVLVGGLGLGYTAAAALDQRTQSRIRRCPAKYARARFRTAASTAGGTAGMPVKSGRGLFADALVTRFSLLPIEEEGRLNDPRLRENFVERIFAS